MLKHESPKVLVFFKFYFLSTELLNFKFEIQKYGQILCVHKPYYLMPGHIYSIAY